MFPMYDDTYIKDMDLQQYIRVAVNPGYDKQGHPKYLLA